MFCNTWYVTEMAHRCPLFRFHPSTIAHDLLLATAGNHVIYANCESIEFHALGSGKLDSSVNVQIPGHLTT